MVIMQERKVGLDSQCLSYLIDAIYGVREPRDCLAADRKALVRAWLYMPETFYVSETVVSECARIRDMNRRELHDGFVSTLFLEPKVRSRAAVDARTAQLMPFHPQEADCRVLAEAE